MNVQDMEMKSCTFFTQCMIAKLNVFVQEPMYVNLKYGFAITCLI